MLRLSAFFIDEKQPSGQNVEKGDAADCRRDRSAAQLSEKRKSG